ncbi:MAG: ATP-binding cassette domain-containing protein [Paracoccus aminovorans]|nr:ATP-binding cassette domain-containing protein [Paracoccus aminovorans]MDQ7778047.1 ATP-binding cassette domain-containing protein [Paracoccus aminovorans]
MLELNAIRKSFGKIEVLHGVDLNVRAGEVHALLGENGAGKSTLMKILCGIIPPSEGTIRIEGREQRFANYDEAIAAGIGIVFQEFSLIPHLDAVENMFLAREIRGRLGLLDRKAMRARATEIMRQPGRRGGAGRADQPPVGGRAAIRRDRQGSVAGRAHPCP